MLYEEGFFTTNTPFRDTDPIEGKRMKPAPQGPTLDLLESASLPVRTVTFAAQ